MRLSVAVSVWHPLFSLLHTHFINVGLFLTTIILVFVAFESLVNMVLVLPIICVLRTCTYIHTSIDTLVSWKSAQEVYLYVFSISNYLCTQTELLVASHHLSCACVVTVHTCTCSFQE